MGDQIKQGFQKLKAFWTALSPKIKKLFIFGVIGLLALAVALTVYLNAKAGKFQVLFPKLESTQVTETYQVVQELGYEVRLDGEGRILVPSDQYDAIVADISRTYYPKSTLDYSLYDENASGLTTTDADKRQYALHALQNRLQDTIRQYGGVENVVVTLNLPETNIKVWEKAAPKGSASVSITFKDDIKYTPEQVSSIKWLVSASVPGIAKEDVVVNDARTSLTLKGTEDEDPNSIDALGKRLEFEKKLEEKLEEKARNVLSVIFEPEKIRIASTVRINYDKLKRETTTYSPVEGSPNLAGVLQHADSTSITGATQPAAGVPGEEDNTDLPTYNNQLTENGSYSENSSSADYLVSQMIEQIEQDPAKFTDATIAVTINADEDTVDQTVRDSIVETVSKATNIQPNNISVQNYAVVEPEPPNPPIVPTLTQQQILIIGAALLVLLLLLIIILVLVGKARKRKKQDEVLEAATADVIELQEEDDTEFNLQQELEERKRQLRESAAKTADEAIADEVRDFAKSNPEITANLLRAWMKEEID